MIGMKMTGVKGMGMGLMLGLTVLTSCTKEVAEQPAQAVSVTTAESAQYADSVLAKFFSAPFGTRGSRTSFVGVVSDTTAYISLDYFIDKKFRYAGNEKLVFDYGDFSLYRKGWQYEVMYDRTSGSIVLAPNKVMADQTVPGSFKTIQAIFDKSTSTFNFMTEVKDLDGNVHQVVEIITRK